jgi:hypothetical protein
MVPLSTGGLGGIEVGAARWIRPRDIATTDGALKPPPLCLRNVTE